jgi:hypothetical protein
VFVDASLDDELFDVDRILALVEVFSSSDTPCLPG